jgi:hypothetical protein
MVDVTDGPDIDVGLVALELLLRHRLPPGTSHVVETNLYLFSSDVLWSHTLG